MAVNTTSSILCAFLQCTHLEAVCLVKDVCCLSFFLRTSMVEAYGNSLGPSAALVNCFQGPCCSRIKQFWVTFSMLLAVFPFLLLKTFRHQQSFRRTFFRCFQLFARLTAFFAHVYPSTKLAKRSHEHYSRIGMRSMCKAWFPYDRFDRPQNLGRSGRSYGNTVVDRRFRRSGRSRRLPSQGSPSFYLRRSGRSARSNIFEWKLSRTTGAIPKYRW